MSVPVGTEDSDAHACWTKGFHFKRVSEERITQLAPKTMLFPGTCLLRKAISAATKPLSVTAAGPVPGDDGATTPTQKEDHGEHASRPCRELLPIFGGCGGHGRGSSPRV
eukprot:5605129-Pyramimonas_sp.AAC.1